MDFINETVHPNAVELTNLLFTLGAQPPEERAYEVLENSMMHLGDEAKADLYARIAELPLAERGRINGMHLVSKALWQNQQAYPRG